MQTHHVLVVSFGFKLGIFLLCLSFLYGNRLFSQTYFNTTISDDKVQQSVKETEDRDVRNDQGLTGLMVAAVNGNNVLAKTLFEYGANLNLQSSKEQQTALHYATNNMRVKGSQDVGYYLIDVYADTSLRNIFGQTPLHLVTSTDVNADRNKMVEYLIKNGAPINAQTDQGDTLLHLAVNMKNINWIESLLAQWSPLIDFSLKNKKGLTPLQYAKELGFGTIADALSKTYPAITTATARDTNGLTGLMLAIMCDDQKKIGIMAKNKKAINLKSNDQYNNSALHIALIYQNVTAAKNLVNHGADLAIKNSRAEIPTHFLIRVWNENKKLEIAKMILNKAPRSILAKDNKGNNVLHYIAQYNDISLLNYLIKYHKPIVQQATTTKNKALETPITLANKLNRKTIVTLLSQTLKNK